MRKALAYILFLFSDAFLPRAASDPHTEDIITAVYYQHLFYRKVGLFGLSRVRSYKPVCARQRIVHRRVHPFKTGGYLHYIYFFLYFFLFLYLFYFALVSYKSRLFLSAIVTHIHTLRLFSSAIAATNIHCGLFSQLAQ